ncbi:maleylpyruvate isomerase family mycothiol-dependent enzyme [Nocardioides bruguierae]|uniref:Maleylpyruvate isomerase family mycothiol-dependent enzyme n=1 Tax=Nocardioides bruguierae TaxID=2945102 RepID=A0A9X2IEP1_9ACTN|nr:maleylpyruvate isomerase family mycothiol-dependent enzyme [Nocardioides bruguierae]MCL8025641.1 maleylpyruvate isomerase family mycothiol-dependent enzyme [Nocardioides bruguierae]MCM0620497.1 maleylpyruvate isomerase family mycothiol-dependent enzyme [Nocardioides bruguierae]
MPVDPERTPEPVSAPLPLTTEQTWSAVARERRYVADLVQSLTPAQWSTPSLCRAWTVGQVAVHLTAPMTISVPDLALAVATHWFSYDKAMNALVKERAAALPDDEGAEIVADRLRTGCGNRFAPPGLGPLAPLTDLRVHTLDMAVPLGLDVAHDPAVWPHVLGFLVGTPARLGAFTRGRRPAVTLTTTDVDWTHGTGPRVEGPAHRVALALTGRSRGLDGLTGPGVEPLRAWIAR